MDDREKKSVIDAFTVDSMASIAILILGSASEHHRELFRTMLEKVFDLSATNAHCASADSLARASFKAAAELAAQVRELVTQVHKDIDGLEKRIDAIDVEFERRTVAMREHVARLSGRVKEVAEKLNNMV